MTIAAKDEIIQIEKMSLGPYETNTYIVTCLETKTGVVIDAPGDAEKVFEAVKGTDVKYILMTHNHMDHTGAMAELRSGLGVPIAAHEADAGHMPVKPDLFLKDGDTLTIGDLEIRVIHTPGHTPGGLCFYVGDYLLAGDTIFKDGPGRTGSPPALTQVIESITEKIFTLPDETRIFPGHGDFAVLKEEKDKYSVFASKSHDPKLCGDIVWLTS
ncbi:MAG: MBL fold metallo-hydrolase [Dehalococcoidales bacterium]|nr:MAG: MBL fold metallo-hydrolase [Dehalococcoidales bacterium]